MCGVAGLVGLAAGDRVQMDLLRAMADSLRHRGPDGHGYWVSGEGNVGLAHRRLAIVDLSDAARQPMSSADGTVHVTFNGEIYNFRELRSELEGKGYRFRSQSDTEVLVNLYSEAGDSAIDRLDGDFALGLWDERRKRLLLARDRAGVKPLYYCELDGLFLVVPPPRTLLRNVFKLPAASVLTLELNHGWRTRRYWEPLPGRVTPDRRDLDGQLQTLFQRSV